MKYSNTLILIKRNDRELSRKIREIWNKIIELIGINNANDYVRNTEYGDEYTTTNIHENTSFVEGNYRDELVIVLHSVIDNYLKASLVQVKIHTHINFINKNTIKGYNHSMHTEIIIKKFLLFFFF